MITDQLRAFFAGSNFNQVRTFINTTGRPFCLRPTDQQPLTITREHVDDILHEYAPELSSAVSQTTIVIFKPLPTTTDRPHD